MYNLGMSPAEILAFLQRHPLAVEASSGPAGAPQAAVVGVVVSDTFEVFFDTLSNSRKCSNLRRDPRIALVFGWDADTGCTLQLEGTADEPGEAELKRLKPLYFARFADGVERQAWPLITYFRVRPSWLRFSDFSGAEPRIVEFSARALAQVR
jgi:hypothetical protein